MNNDYTILNLSSSKRLLRAILLTGLLAGLLDGIAAVILFLSSGGKNPIFVFQFIASGVFGRELAFSATYMAVLGLVFHLVIAMGWTVLYFLAYPKISWMSQKPVVSGIIYGLFVWVMMNQVVLPLSNVPRLPFDIAKAIMNMAVLVVAIGLPISLRARKYYSNK